MFEADVSSAELRRHRVGPSFGVKKLKLEQKISYSLTCGQKSERLILINIDREFK